MQRVKIDFFEISNYLGAGEETVRIELGGIDALLCGPNGSGKTTLMSAMDLMSRLFSQLSPVTSTAASFVDVQAWTDARPLVTADLFHRTASEAVFRFGFSVPAEVANVRAVANVARIRANDVYHVGLCFLLRKDQKLSLDELSIDGTQVFRKGVPTGLLNLAKQQPADTTRYELMPRQMQHLQNEAASMFSIPRALAQRILYVPSRRDPALGPHSQLNIMASGRGLTSWIRAAANPDPRDAESARRHEVLQQFQEEFAEFAGLARLSLSAPEVTEPVRPGEEPEISITIDGQARPVSRLGAGIGESFVILLLSKLAQELDPPIDVVLLEEPELHLHPSLQRRLIDRLGKADVQLVTSTHSPTVVDAFFRRGSRVIRTKYQGSAGRITAQPVAGTREARLLLDAIGASPADLFLADKVLWVEGASDIPVFKAWISKAPSFRAQNVSVISIGGHDAASEHFDGSHLRNLHPKMCAVLDSEKRGSSADADPAKVRIKEKLEANGIRCHLTERRATESYFTRRALSAVYPQCPPELDPHGDPNLVNQGVNGFSKYRNGEVAEKMEWQELAGTDVGKFIEEVLCSRTG